jgi:hypothetical protein
MVTCVALVAAAGCQPAPGPAVRTPLADVVRAVQQDTQALQTIVASGPSVSHELGALNGKLQSRGYFRRVPAQAAVDSLQSQLRRLATSKVLTVTELQVDAPAENPIVAPRLQAGERWQPRLDDLRGVLSLRLGVQGSPKDIEAFVAALPTACDRLVVLTSSQPRAGGVLLGGEAYYERQVPQPEVTLPWPSADERLRGGGWDPRAPELAAIPEVAVLRKAVEDATPQLAEARRILTITADFPRWLLRWQFFEERSKAVLSVQAAALAHPPPQGLRTNTK